MRIKLFFKKAILIASQGIGYLFFSFFPVDKKLFVFQSEGDFWDNAYALFDYMIRNEYNI